ncbi:NYN domain-containing protein, partial [Allosphingosinicella sp.]|uniref:NYN domain-containing protein n=1 Tax=Allosphingosinicella sp. TaxID=2823234 RepID=UPI002EF86968
MPETRPSHAGNIALLIDADNASPDSLDAVLTVLAELGTVNIRRAYGNWSKGELKGWAKIIHRHAIEPQQQFDVAKGKSATDMKMTIDAMDLVFGGRVHGFGIMSSDSDFMPLAVRIKQDGLPVYGFGTAKTPEAFREACTRFIDVRALAKADQQDELEDKAPAGKREVDEELVKLLGAAFRAAQRDERG